MCIYDTSTRQAQVVVAEIQGHRQLLRKLKTSLGYMRSCNPTITTTTTKRKKKTNFQIILK